MDEPLAIVTVDFSRKVKGSELIGGVKAIISDDNQPSTTFYCDQRFDNGDVFVIGQHSKYPYDQILVSPNRELSGIRPDEIYSKIEVLSTIWPGPAYCVGYEQDAVTQATRQFAERLKRHFDNSSNSSTANPWPQELKVCAICENIVHRRGFDDYHCPNDGQNPPIKTIKVIPAIV